MYADRRCYADRSQRETAVKTWVLLVPALLVPAEASAIQRYTSTSMTCDRIQAVLKSGPAILQYPSSGGAGMSYDRYFGAGNICPPYQSLMPAKVPSADLKSCRVYRCGQRSNPGGGRGGR